MDYITSCLFAASIAWICIILVLTSHYRARKLPPGPYRLPIIGNILHLGPKPHRSLAKLARKYGPVMSLKLGSVTAIVFSTPDAAKMVLQKHDSSFSSRTISHSVEAHGHHELSLAWLPAGKQWRKLRKICKEHMFSVARLDASEGLRKEKLRQLRGYVAECGQAGRAVDIGREAFTTSLNLISASFFSVDFAELGSDASQEIKDVVWGVMECFGSPNLSDFFPLLKSADPQGIFKRMNFFEGKLLAIFDGIIDERLKSRGEKSDLLEALIDLHQRDEAQLTRNDITHLLMDLFLAGTDTISGTVEWAMTELVRNPGKMSKLTNEIRNFVEENGQVQESDVPQLPYLQAVVKETFRLHPVAPLLVPHKANCDVEMNGYIVPKNAQILINVWASGRDPGIWDKAEEFVPERFLNENDGVGFKGQDFKLIPFGAGRRICPGMQLADRMVHQMLVIFVSDFEWKLEMMKPNELNMDEKFGITLQKAIPLKAIPVKLD